MAYARMVLRLNHGTADIELTRPLEAVDHLLASLQILCGLALLAQPDRYTLFYRCGRLFNPIEVGYEIASLIQDAFYVDMELNFTASLGLVHSRFRASKLTAPAKHAKEERESGRCY